MKTILLLSLPILLAACAGRPEPVVHVMPASVPGTTLPVEGMEGVRYAENIRAYPLGRYVDPNNPGIMHDGHTIYRVETTPKWNLHPRQTSQAAPVSSSVSMGPITRIRDTAKTTTLMRDELAAELNRQKEVTKMVIQNSEAVTRKFGEMGVAVQQTRQMAGQAAQLQQEIDSTKQRLDLLEKELRNQQKATPVQQPDQFEKSGW